jgi:hypothetical protein
VSSLQRSRDDVPLVPGPVIAWRAWALSGHDEMLRLRPVGRFARPWPPRRAVEAACGHWRLHRAPSLGCTCGVHATREPELLRRAHGPAVVGTVALRGTIVEHALGYRARFGYPQRLCLVCPICFWQLGAARSRAPVVVAALRRGPTMPLCDRHLGTAFAVGVSMRRLTPSGDALQALLDLYSIEELSLLDASQVREATEGESPVAEKDRPPDCVDEKLTERRDEESLDGSQRTHETGADLRFSRSEPVTSGFGGLPPLLDAEEARGSNPLAPTRTAGQRPFSPAADLFLSAEERLCSARTWNPAGQTVCGSCGSGAESVMGDGEVDEKLTRAAASAVAASAGSPCPARLEDDPSPCPPSCQERHRRSVCPATQPVREGRGRGA